MCSTCARPLGGTQHVGGSRVSHQQDVYFLTLRPFRVRVTWWPALKLPSAQCQRPRPGRSSPGITGRRGGTFPTETRLQCHFELPGAAVTVGRACRRTRSPAAAPQGGLKITRCPASPAAGVSGKVRHCTGNKGRRQLPLFAISVQSEHLKARHLRGP